MREWIPCLEWTSSGLQCVRMELLYHRWCSPEQWKKTGRSAFQSVTHCPCYYWLLEPTFTCNYFLSCPVSVCILAPLWSFYPRSHGLTMAGESVWSLCINCCQWWQFVSYSSLGVLFRALNAIWCLISCCHGRIEGCLSLSHRLNCFWLWLVWSKATAAEAMTECIK